MNNFKSLLAILVMAFAVPFCTNALQAQCYGNNSPVNELGVRLGSLTNAAGVGGGNITEQSAHAGFLNGIHYKRYSPTGAFRASLGLTRFDYENRRNCPNCLRTDAKVTGVTLRAGYEVFAFLGPLEPFVGIDAVFSYGTYQGETYSIGSDAYQETTWNRERTGVGLGPVAGLRLYLSYSISVSAETSVEAMFYSRKTNIARISPETNSTYRQNNYFDTTFQPLNWLSVNVLF